MQLSVACEYEDGWPYVDQNQIVLLDYNGAERTRVTVPADLPFQNLHLLWRVEEETLYLLEIHEDGRVRNIKIDFEGNFLGFIESPLFWNHTSFLCEGREDGYIIGIPENNPGSIYQTWISTEMSVYEADVNKCKKVASLHLPESYKNSCSWLTYSLQTGNEIYVFGYTLNSEVEYSHHFMLELDQSQHIIDFIEMNLGAYQQVIFAEENSGELIVVTDRITFPNLFLAEAEDGVRIWAISKDGR